MKILAIQKPNHKVYLHIKCKIRVIITQTHSTEQSYGTCNFSLQMPKILRVWICECERAPTHESMHTPMHIQKSSCTTWLSFAPKLFRTSMILFPSYCLSFFFIYTFERALLLQILENKNKQKNWNAKSRLIFIYMIFESRKIRKRFAMKA